MACPRLAGNVFLTAQQQLNTQEIDMSTLTAAGYNAMIALITLLSSDELLARRTRKIRQEGIRSRKARAGLDTRPAREIQIEIDAIDLILRYRGITAA
jgi:hypothetical protein